MVNGGLREIRIVDLAISEWECQKARNETTEIVVEDSVKIDRGFGGIWAFGKSTSSRHHDFECVCIRTLNMYEEVSSPMQVRYLPFRVITLFIMRMDTALELLLQLMCAESSTNIKQIHVNMSR